MREINMIVVHCTATYPKQDIGVKEIDVWHRKAGANGCGYHYVVRLDGTIEPGRALDEIGAHVKGFNRDSIGIAYVGGLTASGLPSDTRTSAQIYALKKLIRELRQKFGMWIPVLGHHNLNPGKCCPCFNAIKEYNGYNALYL